MNRLPTTARLLFSLALASAVLRAQVSVSGRVIDETGTAVSGARVELSREGVPTAAASSDLAGNFTLSLPAPGEYAIRAERQGFYLLRSPGQRFEAGANQLTVTMNHLQEISDSVDVVSSAGAVDPQQTADHRELDKTEILAVPYPAPQDFRNALPMMNGVLQDSSGRVHVNGGDVSQTNYTLDGFNISDPVTGRMEARVNIDAIQSVNLETSRFSADNGRGSAGALDLQTKMGDDRWRFTGTNFVPGVATDTGLHVNKWTPRVEVSGPLVRGRVWFHNAFDGFYSMDVVHGLPAGQNTMRGVSGNNLTRFQINLKPSNILTGSFLVNLANNTHYGLSIVNPAEATNTHRQRLFFSSVRDQKYFGGALLDLGFADTRTVTHDTPQGDQVYQITPFGARGNYFVNMERHAYRQQWLANVFLPTFRWQGEHQFKFGIDFEREAFHQKVVRHPYEVLRDDGSMARYVSFAGSPFQARKNFESAQFLQDHWTPFEGLALDAGLRAEWNEIVRALEVAPRLAAVWAPRSLRDTKFSAGWGVYYDAISLALVSSQQDQVSLATFYTPGGLPQGPLITSFHVDDQALSAPRYSTSSAGVERNLPGAFHLKVEYTRRAGNRGLAFAPGNPGGVPFATPIDPSAPIPPNSNAAYFLQSARRDRYDALDISVRHTFARQYEWFAGYTRSSARTSGAVEYSLENPILAPQAPGPFPWDAPNRFHMWGWLPLPNRSLPARLRFFTRNTAAAYLVEYRTGFPFSVVDERGFQLGGPGSMRFPDYFNINLHLERKFHALHYYWAWRFGFNNLTNNGNPNTVNNVQGTPAFLAYGRGQVRAFSVRLRMLGRK